MPRRTSTPRMLKYQTIPANRTTARFTAKLMEIEGEVHVPGPQDSIVPQR